MAGEWRTGVLLVVDTLARQVTPDWTLVSGVVKVEELVVSARLTVLSKTLVLLVATRLFVVNARLWLTAYESLLALRVLVR